MTLPPKAISYFIFGYLAHFAAIATAPYMMGFVLLKLQGAPAKVTSKIL